MTDLTIDDKLIVLIEECSEVVKAATKCLRFGWDRNQPDYGINDVVLAKEIGELLGVIDSLPLNRDQIEVSRANKMARVLWAKEKFGRKESAASITSVNIAAGGGVSGPGVSPYPPDDKITVAGGHREK